MLASGLSSRFQYLNTGLDCCLYKGFRTYRLGWLVVRGQRTVQQPRRVVEPASAIRDHDERLRARQCVEPGLLHVARSARRLGFGKVGRVVAGPFFSIPPDPALPLAPGLALEIGRGAVVEHPTVGRPGPAPISLAVAHPWRIGFLPSREILVRRGIDATVDPRGAGGGSVVLQLVEAIQMLIWLTGDITIDLPQHLKWVWFARWAG